MNRCDDPLKHPFEPNGDGHSHFQDLCWWCGKDDAAHKKLAEIDEAENEERICAGCRLYETPRCWERKQSGRNPGALDWCAGWKG